MVRSKRSQQQQWKSSRKLSSALRIFSARPSSTHSTAAAIPRSVAATPRTVTRLMMQHRESERDRHHGLNEGISEVVRRIPGYTTFRADSKIVKLRRVISYVCHLENHIEAVCREVNINVDFKQLLLTSHLTATHSNGSSHSNSKQSSPIVPCSSHVNELLSTLITSRKRGIDLYEGEGEQPLLANFSQWFGQRSVNSSHECVEARSHPVKRTTARQRRQWTVLKNEPLPPSLQHTQPAAGALAGQDPHVPVNNKPIQRVLNQWIDRTDESVGFGIENYQTLAVDETLGLSILKQRSLVDLHGQVSRAATKVEDPDSKVQQTAKTSEPLVLISQKRRIMKRNNPNGWMNGILVKNELLEPAVGQYGKPKVIRMGLIQSSAVGQNSLGLRNYNIRPEALIREDQIQRMQAKQETPVQQKDNIGKRNFGELARGIGTRAKDGFSKVMATDVYGNGSVVMGRNSATPADGELQKRRVWIVVSRRLQEQNKAGTPAVGQQQTGPSAAYLRSTPSKIIIQAIKSKECSDSKLLWSDGSSNCSSQGRLSPDGDEIIAQVAY